MPRDYSLDKTPPNAMRKADRACDDAWIRQFLASAQIGHIATRWENQPFITPNLFWYDPERHEIYFHTSTVGRLRANSERFPEVCFEASQMGALLPSNVAVEFSMQYESVVAFGRIRLIDDPEEQRRALYGLIDKYFPGMQPGVHYRPIADSELKPTAVFAIAIDSWSGKRSWPERARQSSDWPPLADPT
ncbi:MAG: pyridoxamine 5'-phosphate oxidase family protein [Anaerolineales bacterium]|nr:pyridoxamine 5'-phosphate oxidase family protein [Anaerolineales bacterium]